MSADSISQSLGWIIFQVAVGGAIGCVGRYLTDLYFARAVDSNFPIATLVINVTGSLLVGIIYMLILNISDDASRIGPFIIAGVLGGYTTFSAFSIATWILFEENRIAEMILFATGTTILSILACFAGIGLVKLIQG